VDECRLRADIPLTWSAHTLAERVNDSPKQSKGCHRFDLLHDPHCSTPCPIITQLTESKLHPAWTNRRALVELRMH
jgi:hypothetical protein